jgi:type I restriction enzyme R subunit
VIDGYLVDHEPPTRIVTKHAADGIHYEAHEEVQVLDRSTYAVSTEVLPDRVDFEVDDFHRKVISEEFNRVVLEELAKHIDPEGDEKTVIFCVNDKHADEVVGLLKGAFDVRYGAVDDDAVQKITGASHQPLDAIRRFKNERYPNVAVTVDLLTTGIDVPRIANLVFLRRVASRILYEQMIGRATRLCPEIGKERFRIFDAVDLYGRLASVSAMKPVVMNPAVTFASLVEEILAAKTDADALPAIEQFLGKFQRKKRSLEGRNGESFAAAAGMDAKAFAGLLKHGSREKVAAFFQAHEHVAQVLDRASGSCPNAYRTVISEQLDELREVSHGYGPDGRGRPSDYLDDFRRFVTEHMNRIPALLVVVQRPRDLTRKQLKELRLALDAEGFDETKLRTAWADAKSEDVASNIIGYIRGLALGSPLIPYGQRVDRAVESLMRTRTFTAPQKRWLERIAKQLKAEVIVDRASFDAGAFAEGGGFARIDKIFEGQLLTVVGELAEGVWKDAG